MKVDAAAGGDGSRNRPFATLEQVEEASAPGDTIRVLPSTRPLDGGIQLKDNQRLIGFGDPVTKASPNSARPTITNTTSTRYNGDAIRLANNTLVQNIHIDGAARSGIFGVNAARAQIRGNLITNNMIQGNDLPRLERLWPDGFVLYQSRLSGASNGLKAFKLAVRNTRFSGMGGAVGILNTNNVETLNVLVEDSSLSDFTQPPGAKPIAAVTVTHPGDKTIGTAIIDPGGGSLGSRGRNRFVNNAGFDVSVTTANAATAPISVDASGNYWGGGVPIRAPSTPADVSVTGHVMFNAPTHLTRDPAR